MLLGSIGTDTSETDRVRQHCGHLSDKPSGSLSWRLKEKRAVMRRRCPLP